MTIKPNLKQIQTGKIPEEWEAKKVVDLFNVETGTTPSTKKREYWAKGEINWITPADMSKLKDNITLLHSQRRITKKALKDTNLTLMSKDSIIISTRAPVGYVGVVREGSTFNQGCKGLIPKDSEKLNTLFYAYYLLSKRKHLQNISGGSTFKELSKNLLQNLDVPFPPIPEQKAIAEILSTADEAIQKSDEITAKTELLKKGLMQELLTKGIGHEEFKDTEIGRIPKAWEVKTTMDLFSIETGTTPSTRQKDYWIDGVINWITPADMSKLDNDIELKDSRRKITEKAVKETNLTLMLGKSIIISTRAPVGYIGLVKEETTFNQGCKGLIPKNFDEICPEFYCYYLLSKKQLLQNLSSGSTFKELSKKILENLKIPLPPLPEQQKIASILSTVDKRLELERSRKQKLERIKKGLMNDLLTRNKRVGVSR